ncbi:synaptotagmin-15-like isoform X1 [Daphnia magna]|uniref:synaptotagmin-15-like isoform X1 n=1 Tax=Daphnia magna TaxID=35525 RepID=UPI0006E789A8|nr:synaptotagmin-15-like isoform X1 [Daphnia magna]
MKSNVSHPRCLGVVCKENNAALQCKRYPTCRSKEIEFTLPPGAFSCTPPRSRRANQTLDIPTKNGPSLSPSDAHIGNNVRQRRFSTALLFPGRVDGTSSPLLSPSILLHCSAPSSPIPNYSPSPAHSPCLSPLPSLFNFFRERSPSPARSRTPSPAKEVSPPTTSSRNSPILSGVTSNIGALNPDLYKSPLIPEEDTNNYPEGHLGRFWFSISYDSEQEKLLINLIRIHNLPSRDKDSTNACDPLVRVALLPGERRYHQSSIQRKTCNPVFNEVFGFCVSHKELQEQTIKFTVIDNGRLRKRQVIGHLLCSLKHISIEDGKQQIITQDISKDPSSVGSPGEMHISLCYHPSADRFTVTILQARNIRAPNTAVPDSYVRLTLFNQTRAVKTKRTGIIRRSADPCYNESFHFRLEATNVDTTNIVLAIHQPDNKDRILGRLVLGSFMFARGRGMAHWNEMFARPREHIQLWHPLPDLN